MQELLRERGERGGERESVERFAGEGEEKRGEGWVGGWVSERRFAAKHSRSVDGKRTTIWSPCSTSLLPLETHHRS